MIMDADVLIDFLKVDRSVLNLIVQYVGPIHVVSPVAGEIGEVDDEEELVELGLLIIEPEVEDGFEAMDWPPGPTSFQDRLCLLTARRHGYTCVTNDKRLRKLCARENVPVLWSLELMLELHGAGGISTEDALDIATGIHEVNSRHITLDILDRFRVRLRGKG